MENVFNVGGLGEDGDHDFLRGFVSDWQCGVGFLRREGGDEGCQRIGFDVEFESGKGLHDASHQLRSLRLEHAHHKENAR